MGGLLVMRADEPGRMVVTVATSSILLCTTMAGATVATWVVQELH